MELNGERNNDTKRNHGTEWNHGTKRNHGTERNHGTAYTRFLLVRARSLLLPGGQGRLSFIGHSAGAVIIRVALTSPSLQPALGRLHMFVSLGSPHLGTVYGASGIVRTGMWAMKRWGVCWCVGGLTVGGGGVAEVCVCVCVCRRVSLLSASTALAQKGISLIAAINRKRLCVCVLRNTCVDLFSCYLFGRQS